MIRILLLSFTILGFGSYLLACPFSGTLKSLNGAFMVGYDAGHDVSHDVSPFQSKFEGSEVILAPEDFSPSYDRGRTPAQEQAPEFVAPPISPEVVRIVLMGSGLICLAALWRRRESRRLSHFV